MTNKEFKETLKAIKRIKPDAEVKLHTESGDYDISTIEYSKCDNVLRICTMDETRRQVFRISYLITKDHHTFAYNTVRKTLDSEDDIIFNIEDWEHKFLEECGITGEISDKTGSTVVNETEQRVEIDKDTEKAKWVEKEVNHYYNCKILEIFKEIDDENDIYVRVWKNGNIG